MNRPELLERIAELDKQITHQVQVNRVPKSNTGHTTFPMGSWIAALVFIGLWVFGGAFLGDLHTKYAVWALVVGGLCALSALYGTVMWVLRGRVKVDQKYMDAMEKIKALQDERKELQKQLNSMNKQ